MWLSLELAITFQTCDILKYVHEMDEPQSPKVNLNLQPLVLISCLEAKDTEV